jgi:hypothetical protein
MRLFLDTFVITFDRLLKLLCPSFCLHAYANSRSAALNFKRRDIQAFKCKLLTHINFLSLQDIATTTSREELPDFLCAFFS